MRTETHPMAARRVLKHFGPWHRHSLLLAGMAVLLLLLCQQDVTAIIGIWNQTGAFHHCFLIPPILVWLVWQRRETVARQLPEYAAQGVVVVAGSAAVWLIGAASDVELLRQAGLVFSGIGLVIAILGRPIARTLRFPLAFALFLIPAGSEAEPFLQIVTARIAVALLRVTGTPAMLEGVFVETPAGLFRVAEACSGTAFLLAMAAYAALVAVMCFESKTHRLLFCAAAMTVALLTNGIRAFAVMKLANLTSIRNPWVQDHLLFGWLLFALGLVLLMGASSRWFDRDGNVAVGDTHVRQDGGASGRYVLPALLAALLLPRLWLAVTEPAIAMPPPPIPPALAGWTRITGGEPDWQPHFTGATWIGQWRYRKADRVMDFAVILFDRQEEGKELVAFGQGADGDWAKEADADAPAHGRGEILRAANGQLRYASTWYLIGGEVTGSRIAAKIAATRIRLTGGDPVATAIVLSTPGADGAALTHDFIRAAGSIQLMADRARAMR